jgi:valyl-tRNA synthetase
LTRHDLGRDDFVGEIWSWYRASGRRIVEQLRTMGASLDWSREVFTMDAARSEAVREAFVRLHRRGLIYRGERMVHWCPHLRTVLSDIEVDYVSLEGGPTRLTLPGREQPVEFGLMHHFAYPLAPGTAAAAAAAAAGEIVVGTTRLETMLGDVAVCVHPEDPRYAPLIGGDVVHPIHGHTLPIIGKHAVFLDARGLF